jgi:hypothetical protein
MRAQYVPVSRHRLPDGQRIIRIADLNAGKMSITNDAEAVVKDVVGKYGQVLIEYIDTNGNVDRLVHQQGVFVSFAPGPWVRVESP